MTTNDKAVVKPDAIPTSYEEITSMAKAFVQSGMFQDTKQIAQAIVKIQAGRELGLPPVYSMQNINMIRDRLTSSANTMAMLVKRSGHYNYRIKEHTDEACAITFYEKDADKWAEIGTSTFSMADAKRANLVKPDSGWVKFPRAMLFSRAISQGARIYAPDAIGGMYTDEEIRSIPPKPNDTETVVDEKTEPAKEPSPEGSKPVTEKAEGQPASKVKAETGEETDNPSYKTDPKTIKDKTAFQKACLDFGLRSATDITKELNISSLLDIPDWGEAYMKIAAARK